MILLEWPQYYLKYILVFKTHDPKEFFRAQRQRLFQCWNNDFKIEGFPQHFKEIPGFPKHFKELQVFLQYFKKIPGFPPTFKGKF